jgi:O-antigen ligase
MKRFAFAALLVLPVCLLHARAGAEICIGIIDVLFIANLAVTRDWAVLKQPWFGIALVWWLWEVLCSLPIPAAGFGVSGWAGLAEAVLLIRLIVLAAALQSWLLTTPAARHAVWILVALSLLWIGVESWQQYLTGRNIFGDPPWPRGGMLTGPFLKPRAGTPYAHLVAIALLPVIMPMLARKNAWPRIAAVVLVILSIATIVLIGQRTPIMLTVLALAASAFFIPRIRFAAVAGIAGGLAVLAATPLIAPRIYYRDVVYFLNQMSHFAATDYGQLYTRAVTMAVYSPWHGYGFDGFRTDCSNPLFDAGVPGLGLPPTNPGLGACNLHPHNFYLNALTDGGFPGMLLFAALNLAWLIALARGLRQNPDPLRVGLFAGVLTYAWPLASADNFATLPHAGWLFLILGLGLAAAHIAANPIISDAKNA